MSWREARTYARRPSGPKISIGWSDGISILTAQTEQPGQAEGVVPPWKCVTKIASTLPALLGSCAAPGLAWLRRRRTGGAVVA